MRELHPDAQRTEPAVPYARLASVLWSERETLEVLVYGLAMQQLVLESASERWLIRSDDEVRSALGALRTTEVVRAAEVEALADELDLPLEINLAALSDGAPEPWRTMFAEHREALRILLDEVDTMAAVNRWLLAKAATSGEGHGRRGRGILEENAYQTALRTYEGVRQMSLLTFLESSGPS